jgi:hypothetical protein
MFQENQLNTTEHNIENVNAVAQQDLRPHPDSKHLKHRPEGLQLSRRLTAHPGTSATPQNPLTAWSPIERGRRG